MTHTSPRTHALQQTMWGAFLFILIAVIGIGLWSWFSQSSAGEPVSRLPIYGTVPDFSLMERSALPLTRADLAGKIWIANFIFTHCPDACLLLSKKMAILQRMLRAAPVTLVSFSVDPTRDTPQVLQRYAKRYEANPQRWLFITGEQAALHKLIQDGFHVSVAILPSDDPRLTGEPIVHSNRFVLVDELFRIRGYYHGNDEELVPHLLRDVEILQQEQQLWPSSPTSLPSTPS